MTQIGNIKHVFPGSNTPHGFHSFFSYILPQKEAHQLYIITGGPGTGKSSFMKRIGVYATEQGLDVEFFHCSSDPQSLDALVIPSLKVGFLDGTAPHVTDPITPGVTDQILNFGNNWDTEKLVPFKEEIMAINDRLKNQFTKSYFYFDAAKSIYDAYIFAESKAINVTAKLKLEKQILSQIFANVTDKEELGLSRHLFSTALTGEGILDYIHTIIGTTKNIYFIKESLGCNSKQLMIQIANTAVSKGYRIECYHSPMDVDKIEDIMIPELNIAITTSHMLHKPRIFPTVIYDMTTALDYSLIKSIEFDLDRDKRLFNDLIDKGCNTIATAKKIHDELEKYYIDAVDFSRIDTLYDTMIETLFPPHN
ncbi:MAG: ATPase [Niameybacter sp.]